MAMISKGLGLYIILCASFFAVNAEAKLFRNAYVQFELPESWNCNLEGTEWVCASTKKDDARESIIILTAKEVGPQDSFASYENYLKVPRLLKLPTGKETPSQVKNSRIRKINDHQWVDSLHLGSEISGYYTRYLATIKDKLAILVTLSAHQKFYTKFSNDYFKAVESLRVVATKDLFAPKALAPVKPGSETIGVGTNTSLPGDEAPPEEENGESHEPLVLGGGGLLLLALGYYMWRKKNI
ncbi:MAG: hypothetical protein SGI74_12860 [Oligoflexia bacterium]|nr:hypothetical protein [Oligoflexia bacterium]